MPLRSVSQHARPIAVHLRTVALSQDHPRLQLAPSQPHLCDHEDLEKIGSSTNAVPIPIKVGVTGQ
eukprot:6930950-Pyramimonas_sp.AAC.1